MTKQVEAKSLTSGMIYWDGSRIEVKRETSSFVCVSLSGSSSGRQYEVARKWKKSSIIFLA